MQCVSRGPTIKMNVINVGIKQTRTTDLEIGLQADCTVNRCPNDSR